jgi:dihydropteroate synthase
MSVYWRPLPQHGPARPADALTLAGGWTWFTHVERLERGVAPRVEPASALPPDWRDRLTAPRAPLAGLDWTVPRLMGVLNVTPDSFSDGGAHLAVADAVARARAMAADVDILDIGGESTRPGARPVPAEEEAARILPVLEALAGEGLPPVSVDTRKASVAEAALAAGARLVNDVSVLGFDPGMAGLVARTGAPLCLMHAQGPPETMQDDPRYDDVLLDVYDALAAQLAAAERAGIARDRIMIDPGIGFGKTGAHNLALLVRLSLFHGLGRPLVLGASRKRFIGVVGGGAGAEVPGGAARAPGSVAVALAAFGQGVQIARVHDTAETAQALRLWRAVGAGGMV